MRLLLVPVLLVLTACGAQPPATGQSQPPATGQSQPPATGQSQPPAPSSSARVSGLASSVPVPLPSRDLTVRLTGDGIDLPTGVVSFGDPLAGAEPGLLRFLGTPTRGSGGTGVRATGTCPGTDLRVLEYAGGALQLFAGTMPGADETTVYAWQLTADRAALPRASALVGDVTTFEFGVGSTLAQLRAGAGEALELRDGASGGAAFTVQDQSGGLTGTLSSTGPDGVVRQVGAGQGCRR